MNNQKNIKIFILIGVLIFGIIGFLAFSTKSTNKQGLSQNNENQDLTISKQDITDVATFYKYKSGNTDLEVMAVKASDGSIRTAFNTCQVCYDSGRGYYVQEGDEMICQNCRNRFQINQIEQIKGGCNPVPIVKEDKTEDESKIVISKEYIARNTSLFSNWKR